MTIPHGRQSRRSKVWRLSAAALLAVSTAVGVFYLVGVRINVTPSLPLGLYIATGHQPSLGEVAEFCPVGMSAEESARYRGFGLACPDRAIPLLKPVVAMAGDRVEFSPSGIVVNGVQIPNTAPRSRDGKGRPIRAFPAGAVTLRKDEVVVASGYHVGSYDSRYMGPIPVSAIRLSLRPLWVVRGDFKKAQPGGTLQ
jgi:conjugative transfer signal peptidase TraF